MFDVIIFLVVMSVIFRIVKKANKVTKRSSLKTPEDFQKLKEQGQKDLQKLLGNLDNYKNTAPTKHIHSDTNYENKDYVQDHKHSFKINEEPIVKRGFFDKRRTDETITRKDYD